MAVPVPKNVSGDTKKRTRRTLVMAVTFVVYLVIGGVTFGALETYEKTVSVTRLAPAWRAVKELVNNNSSSSRADGNSTSPGTRGPDEQSWARLKQAVLHTCNASAEPSLGAILESIREGSYDMSEGLLLCGPEAYVTTQEVRELPWSFIDSAFFCMTVITTIGYGHISPSTPGGQVFCIVYSLIGIPISGLLLAGLSDFFAGNLLAFYETKWRKKFGDSKWTLVAFTALYLAIGFLLFVFAPAAVFCWMEGWSYIESVYYCFITLSTVGFGDYTAGIARDDAWMAVYKLFIMLWVLIGLGYWVLVLNFIQKALKSKEMIKTFQQTSRLIAKEAEDIRNALASAGILQRDAVFVPEHSKNAMSMMMNMSSMLAGGAAHGGGDAADGTAAGNTSPGVLGELKGIHSMGSSLHSNSLLAALMQSVPLKQMSPPSENSAEKVAAPAEGEPLLTASNGGAQRTELP